MEKPKQAIKNILVLCLQGTGNTLLFTPVLKLLRLRIPEAKITVVVGQESSQQLLSGNPHLDQIYLLNTETLFSPLKIFRFISWMRSLKAQICITAFPANRIEFNLISYFSGALIRIGHRYRRKFMRSLSFLQNYRIAVNLQAHDVEQNLALLKPLGMEPALDFEKKPGVFISTQQKHFAESWLKEQGLNIPDLIIGLHPGSSPKRGMSCKRWPAENFARLAVCLHQQYNAKLIVFGGKEEENLKTEVAHLARQDIQPGQGDSRLSTSSHPNHDQDKEKFVFTTPPVEIKNTAALISYCKLFISNDTGLMHLATAVGVPVLGIFGPTDEVRTRPWINGRIVTSPNLNCRPCWTLEDVGLRKTCIHKERICLSQILPEDVVKEAEKLL